MGKKAGGRVRVKQIGPKMPSNPLADLTSIPPEEMIQYPKPDSNAGFLIWPMTQTFSMNYKNFSTIYPNYLDSNKTVKMGRRIAAKDSVPEPTMQDIHEALVDLKIRHVIQPFKGYSRDAESRWYNPGRALVDLEGATESGVLGMRSDGTFDLDDAMPDLADEGGDENVGNTKNGAGDAKKRLLRKLAAAIRELPIRQRRLEADRARQEEERLKAKEAEKAAAASSATVGASGNRKKKGKKKK